MGTERARLGPFRGLGTTRLAIFYQNLRFPAFSKKSQKTVIFLLKKSTQPPKNVKFCIQKVSFFTQKEHPASQKTEFLHEKMTKNVPKRLPTPAKTEVMHEKKCLFLLKKTTQPRKKLKYCMKKMKKNPDPQLHQMFKPITNFFSTFLPI